MLAALEFMDVKFMKCLLVLKKAFVLKQTLVLGGIGLAGGYLYFLSKKSNEDTKPGPDRKNGDKLIEKNSS